MLRGLINSQIWLSCNFDRLLPKKYTMDGNQAYIKSIVPKYLRKHLVVCEVGSGKTPYFDHKKKTLLNAMIIGLDINIEELNQAPKGIYDKIICTDITKYQGDNDTDIVICQALLEHVKDTEKAFSSISSILKPGGLAIIFVPSRNSIYARLNIILPQGIKKKLLHTIYPKTKLNQGFPAYYDKCTPLDFRKLAARSNFTIIEERFYYISSYFSFFFPAYLVWRLWVLLFVFLRKEQAAETFLMVLRKDNVQA